MSKPVIADVVMILLERGEIDLYYPVSKHLLGFNEQMAGKGDNLVLAERKVTIKDLLCNIYSYIYSYKYFTNYNKIILLKNNKIFSVSVECFGKIFIFLENKYR